MNCPQVRDNLSDYSDGLLGPDKTEEIREHLTSCEPCRAQCQTFETMLSALHTLPSVIPSITFSVTLQDRLQELTDRRSRRRWNGWLALQYRMLVPSMVSLVLLLSVGGYLGYQSYQPSESDPLRMVQEGPTAETQEVPVFLTEDNTGFQNPLLQELLEPRDPAAAVGTDYVLYTVSYDQAGTTIGF